MEEKKKQSSLKYPLERNVEFFSLSCPINHALTPSDLSCMDCGVPLGVVYSDTVVLYGMCDITIIIS